MSCAPPGITVTKLNVHGRGTYPTTPGISESGATGQILGRGLGRQWCDLSSRWPGHPVHRIAASTGTAQRRSLACGSSAAKASPPKAAPTRARLRLKEQVRATATAVGEVP